MMVDCPHRMNHNKLISEIECSGGLLRGLRSTPGRADLLEPAAVRNHIIIIMIIVVIKA